MNRQTETRVVLSPNFLTSQENSFCVVSNEGARPLQGLPRPTVCTGFGLSHPSTRAEYSFDVAVNNSSTLQSVLPIPCRMSFGTLSLSSNWLTFAETLPCQRSNHISGQAFVL